MVDFTPTHAWQPIPDDAILPPGLTIRVNMTTGRREARLPHAVEPLTSWRDAVTVLHSVRDKPVNKVVSRSGNGVAKSMAKNNGHFVAETRPAPDLDSMAEILVEIGHRPERTMSLGIFNDAPAEPFVVMAKDALAARLGVDPEDVQVLLGWHEVDGRPTIARLKDNMVLGSWLLLDRDAVRGMPEDLANLDRTAWLAAMDRLIPGLAGAGRIVVPSSSRRVLVDGKPLESSSWHVFVQVTDPDDIGRVWSQLLAKSFLVPLEPDARPWEDPQPLGFLRPKYSRSDPDRVVAWAPWSIFDPSTCQSNRLAFEGSPVARGDGLEIAPPVVEVHDGTRLDLSAFQDLPKDMIPRIESATGATVKLERKGRGRSARILGVEFTSPTLSVDLEIELESGRWTTIAELQESGAGHTRCQSPFRDSTSMAAYYNVHADGSPFVFDSGTNTKYVLPVASGLRGFSDEGLALGLGQAWQDTARYCAPWGRWLFWDGAAWRIDQDLAHMTRARAWLREVADRTTNLQLRKQLDSKSTRANVVDLARSNAELVAPVALWDADPMLLATPGGTVDLTTGELRRANLDDYLTKLTAVAPAPPGTPAPLWQAFLDRITGGDVELQGYLARSAGYALTGLTSEHSLWFGYGVGANGKSTYVETILGIMGDHACTIGTEMLMASPYDRHPTEIARLRGIRLAVGSEVEEGQQWAEAKLKKLTGGDRLQGRFMRRDYFEFDALFKLWIIGNHKPALKNVDEAIRRRLHLAPFLIVVPPAERDTALKDKLKAEWPAILRWAIDGCLEWQRIGLAPPACVLAATQAYLSDEDDIGQWIEARTKRGDKELQASLFMDWQQWAGARGLLVGTSKRFGNSLVERGYHRRKTNLGQTFEGLSLLPLPHSPGR